MDGIATRHGGPGFAITENIKYYGEAAMASAAMRMDHLTPTLIVRGGISPFAHPLFTSMTGIGLGWARQSNNKGIKFVMPLLGLMLAIFIHATWNYSAILAQQYGARCFSPSIRHHGSDFLSPSSSYLFSRSQERDSGSRFPALRSARGLFTPEEYNRLCTWAGAWGRACVR